MNDKVKLMMICWLSFLLFPISCQNYDRTETKRESLARKSHKSNLKNIGLNIVKYSFDNNGKMPESLEELFKSFGSGRYFICHGISKTREPEFNEKFQTDYIYLLESTEFLSLNLQYFCQLS